MKWDPRRYLTYADERGRPFFDLLARVNAVDPTTVVDLGCGPGNLTATLAERWPGARIHGVDSSPEMIAAAPDAERVTFAVADLRAWLDDAEPVDVLLSNATLQWVDGHLDLLPRLATRVRPGGWLAFQVPGNFVEPSHAICTELAAEPQYAAHLAGIAVPAAHDPADYYRVLAGQGMRVDAWETTYLHVLHGPDAVFDWVSGTGARPTIQALPDELREEFVAEFKARLRAAYPDDGGGVLLPFRRVFAVAHRSGEAQ
ncbi:methyltransferase domain-containing protein [Nocardioides sp. AE5]|uniref:methyltransferase domain-containing protein n=1 Tax=Nocardioides sp. AE5 TaxID=2962573 RepID=UPI0028824562|nr:methyltransferase domain-containing protein [Nocardioides sp. AE5]MDT0203750.1 methyltransferase domain-containing protein [Nocardioides sp. AE5]